MSGQPHLSLTLSKELWHELLRASLPIRLAGRRFDSARAVRSVLKRALTVVYLDRVPLPRPPEWVQVHGDWSVQVDSFGWSEPAAGSLGPVAGPARLRARFAATFDVGRGWLEVPIVMEREIGATLRLRAVHYAPLRRAVVAELERLEFVGGIAARVVTHLLMRQVAQLNPIVLVPRSRVEEMVGPMGGSLRMKLGVEDLDVRIDNDEVKLMIRFGFHTDALCDLECSS